MAPPNRLYNGSLLSNSLIILPISRNMARLSLEFDAAFSLCWAFSKSLLISLNVFCMGSRSNVLGSIIQALTVRHLETAQNSTGMALVARTKITERGRRQFVTVPGSFRKRSGLGDTYVRANFSPFFVVSALSSYAFSLNLRAGARFSAHFSDASRGRKRSAPRDGASLRSAFSAGSGICKGPETLSQWKTGQCRE